MNVDVIDRAISSGEISFFDVIKLRQFKKKLLAGTATYGDQQAIAHLLPKQEKPSIKGQIAFTDHSIRIMFERYDRSLQNRLNGAPFSFRYGALKSGQYRFGWYIPLTVGNYQNLQRVFSDEIKRGVVTVKDDSQISALIEKIASEKHAWDVRYQGILKYLNPHLPDGKVLYDYQLEAVEFLLRLRRAILADSMGLGKTVSALAAVWFYLKDNPDAQVWVVCPAKARAVWTDHAGGMGIEIKHFSWAKQPVVTEDGSIVYGGREIGTVHDKIVLILDEAHYAQSMTSKRTQAALALAESADMLFLLTGTPMKNRPSDLYPLLRAIKHPVADDKRYYEAHYCDAQKTRFSAWDVRGASNLDDLHRRTESAILRRTKDHPAIRAQLPQFIRVKQEADSKGIARIYRTRFNDLYRQYNLHLMVNEWSSRNGMSRELLRLMAERQAASIAKVESSIELARDIKDQGDKYLIFTHFRETAETMARRLGVPLIIGGISDDKRAKIVREFQNGKYDGVVATYGAGGDALTLTAASYVIMNDRPFTPADTLQAEARAHRVGQEKPVTCIWLTYGEIDQWLDGLVEYKHQIIEQALEGEVAELEFIPDTPEQIARLALNRIDVLVDQE